jgi:imidazolonepropionase-like amidohydrolase
MAVPPAATLILEDCLLFDGIAAEPAEHRHLLIEAGRITEVSDRPLRSAAARTIALGGRFVMPGLIDAHFHAYGTSMNVVNIDRTLPSLRALQAREMLEETLQRGFTTVRDAAGGDLGLAIATETGLIRGPRIFPAGLALSQTGGHGDGRAPEHYGCGCAYCRSLSIVADGPDEVRKAVREQLRQGATQIKLFVSGGVLSPGDPIWMNQFTDEEIRIAVHEAQTRRTYVMALAHTAEAVKRSVRNGVRSIEHATVLDAEGARVIAEHQAFAVPTLAIIDAIRDLGPALGLTAGMIDKAREVSDHALHSIELLKAAGANIGFGTDLLGITQPRQSSEFRLRREVLSAVEILRSATSVNAALLNKTGEVGAVVPGAFADLLVIDGNPLDDVTVLEQHDRIQAILKEGRFYKNSLPA